jgi:signal transduction histidine kinase
LAGCGAASLAILLTGLGWERARIGSDAADRLIADVRAHVEGERDRVRGLVRTMARDALLIERAATADDERAELFDRLRAAALRAGGSASATVYRPAGPAGQYQILAWSPGPAEDVAADRLSGAAEVFVAPGPAGLRLIAVQPVVEGERHVGVVSAEVVLCPAPRIGAPLPRYELPSPFGPVSVVPTFGGATSEPGGRTAFVVPDDRGRALLEVHYDARQVAEAGRRARRLSITLATLPLLFGLGLTIPPVLWRRRAAHSPAGWLLWSALALSVLALISAGLYGALGRGPLDRGTGRLVMAAAALAAAAIGPVALWWRAGRRLFPADRPLHFAAEQLLAGGLLAAAVLATTWAVDARVGDAAIGRWQVPLSRTPLPLLVDLVAALMIQIAAVWSAAVMLAVVAHRWRLTWRRWTGWLAAAIWVAASVGVAADARLRLEWPIGPVLVVLAAAVLFALMSTSIRHAWRRRSAAIRLVGLFAALVSPVVVSFPLAASAAGRADRRAVELAYAPAMADVEDPAMLSRLVEQVQAEVDAHPRLQALVAIPARAEGVTSQAAFDVWNYTTLARRRVTSEVELYGPVSTLVSRFALNVPGASAGTRSRHEPPASVSCHWQSFVEVSPGPGAERRALHAERGVCAPDGTRAGAVVLHVVPDYRALPYVATSSPYAGLTAGQEPDTGAAPDVRSAVYGWSLRPLFSSGPAPWTLTPAVAAALASSRSAFWARLMSGDQAYDVFLSSDRAAIYAVGVGVPRLVDQLTRLAEVIALVAGLFLVIVAGMTGYAGVAHASFGPLGAVYNDIQASFYRKIFLYFVLAAMGPVLLFALAFRTYTTNKIRAGIDAEAATLAAVAQRVFAEVAAADGGGRLAVPSDDVMAWIRQVIDQDAHVYGGARLLATSQRDLFDSGLLPTRTPADVYRAIALQRRQVFVVPDRLLGGEPYLVAAAPVAGHGSDTAVLSVPLATRQREIEREVEDLNRGVLAGAVLVVLFAAGLGASVAGRVSDPVARLSRATRLVAAGRLDIRLVADTADELGRLVEDFSSMTATLATQRSELGRAHELKAWAEMARQVAHDIKNPLTPIHLAAEHLQRLHDDRGRPLGPAFDQCLTTVLAQVRLLRQIASDFSSYATPVIPRPVTLRLADVVSDVVEPYRQSLDERYRVEVTVPDSLPSLTADRTLLSRALTNILENALQAMPSGGRLDVRARVDDRGLVLDIEDTGVGMDAAAAERAFEPYFSTKTGGSGLGLANARRQVELCGGIVSLVSTPGAGTTVTLRWPAAGSPSGS